MLKKVLRSDYSKLRTKLSSSSIEKNSIAIANNLLDLSIWDKSYYHLYLSIVEKKEVDTTFILSILQGKDKNVVLPKMLDHQTLQHYLLTDDTLLKKNSWNVPEPVSGIEVPTTMIDVVFIPLLAFDLKGNRIGYGKGFYDRFLSTCRSDTVKVGLSFFEAVDRITDISTHDITLDYCVTPFKTYAF